MSHMRCMTSLTHMQDICISPVTRRSESCHIWIGYWYTLMNEWMNECLNAAHVYTGARCEWVMSRIWRSHVTRMDESCCIWMCHWNTWMGEWKTCVHSRKVWISHVLHMDESWHTYGWVMSHMNESWKTWRSLRGKYIRSSKVLMSHVSHMSEWCHTSGWVIAHMNTSHERVNESLEHG